MTTSEAGGETRCGIGTRLRAAREARGLTILQAAEKLHVDARMLESLEAEDFTALGAAVYVRGHLRRYAELVGEAPAELQALYMAAAPPPDLTRIPHRGTNGRSARLLLLALLVLIGFALAGVLWWVLTLPALKPHPVSLEQPSTASAPPGAASAAQLMSAIAEAQAPAARAHAGAGGDAQLALRFSAVSWVEVYDASGRRLLQGLNAADSARTLSGALPLRVVLGNAPGVAVQLNGQTVALEGLVHRDGTARFLLDRSGRAVPVPPLVAHGD